MAQQGSDVWLPAGWQSKSGASPGEFNFGSFENWDPANFNAQDYGSDFWSQMTSYMPQQPQGSQGNLQSGQMQAGRKTGEDLGYTQEPTGEWTIDRSGRQFTMSDADMTKKLLGINAGAGMAGDWAQTATDIWQQDTEALENAEYNNFMAQFGFIQEGVQDAYAGAEDIRQRGQETYDFLIAQAGDLTQKGVESVKRISDWIDQSMSQVRQLGQDAIQTAMSAESEWAKDLAAYKDTTAQQMSKIAIGIKRSIAPVLSAIATGMHSDGTPMTKQEQQLAMQAQQYQVGTQVQDAITPLAFQQEQTLLAGAQHASQLTLATSQTQQQQAQIEEQAGAHFGQILLGALNQQSQYDMGATNLMVQAEQSFTNSKLQAAQMESAAMFTAAQLFENYNPVSWLSGFLNLISVPPESWMKNLGVQFPDQAVA